LLRVIITSLESFEPRTNDDRARPVEFFDVTRDNHEPVNKRGGSPSFDFVAPVGDMQMDAPCREGIVDG
jgi:hypothetical protein